LPRRDYLAGIVDTAFIDLQQQTSAEALLSKIPTHGAQVRSREEYHATHGPAASVRKDISARFVNDFTNEVPPR
jgi:hypothetical protein